MAKKKTDVNQEFQSGDTVQVYLTIQENETERESIFEGEVIRRRGSGKSATFTVRRIGADGVGIERIFPLQSPKIAKIAVIKPGHSRRAKRYYRRSKK